MKRKKLKLFLVLGMIFGETVIYADMLFYYSAAVLPSIIHNKTGTPIGSIQSLSGSKTLAIESIYDNNRTSIYVGDVIVTDENTTTSILLNNNTLIKLGVHTFLKITDYVFDDEIAVSANPNITKPVPFNLIVEGTIEIIDNYIKTVEEPSVEASSLRTMTWNTPNSSKEKISGDFETRTMTYDEYKVYDTINSAIGLDEMEVIKEISSNGGRVLIVKVPSLSNPADTGVYSKVKDLMIDKYDPSVSCVETPRSASWGVRGTDFIHSSGTCSDEPATYVDDGGIDLANSDIDLPLVLDEGEVTRDLMGKETADQELKNDLYEKLYRPDPYILEWRTDNCVIEPSGIEANCYYDSNLTILKQNEYIGSGTYDITLYNSEGNITGVLTQDPSSRNNIYVSKNLQNGYEGVNASFDPNWANYYTYEYDQNNIIRSVHIIGCSPKDINNGYEYFEYYSANGDAILNTTGDWAGENVHGYKEISWCITYETVNAIHNFDWSQSRFYQLELTGS